MHKNYLAGGYGYGHAKQALFDVIIDRFAEERTRYRHFMDNLNEIDQALQIGAEKAKKVANDVLRRVRDKMGY